MIETVAASFTERVKFAKGMTIILTAGAYDDFCISDCLVTCVDCDLAALAQVYVEEINPDGNEYQDCTDGFANWLVRKRYAVRMVADTVHLGDYSTFDANLVPVRKKGLTPGART